MDIILGGPPHVKPVPQSVQVSWLGKKVPKWELLEDWLVIIDGKKYIVPKGYVTDGASIPRWLWWMFPPSYSPSFRAAVFHDFCYSHYHRLVDKKWADKALYEIMLYDGASPMVAKMFHIAVSIGGKGGWK